MKCLAHTHTALKTHYNNMITSKNLRGVKKPFREMFQTLKPQCSTIKGSSKCISETVAYLATVREISPARLIAKVLKFSVYLHNANTQRL